MTLLNPDASNREHRFARHVDHVAAERQADHRVIGQAELAAAEETPSVTQGLSGSPLLPSAPGESH